MEREEIIVHLPSVRAFSDTRDGAASTYFVHVGKRSLQLRTGRFTLSRYLFHQFYGILLKHDVFLALILQDRIVHQTLNVIRKMSYDTASLQARQGNRRREMMIITHFATDQKTMIVC